MTSITELLRELESKRFFGAVEIKFEDGKIVLIRKTENLKLNDYRTVRSGSNGDRAY